jgi:ubiquitin C-terminal hydrolase
MDRVMGAVCESKVTSLYHCRGSRPWIDINKKMYIEYANGHITYRLSRKAYLINRELWIKLKELYGSQFTFEIEVNMKIKENENYRISLEDKELNDIDENKSNLSEDVYLPTESDIAYPLVNTDTAFRRVNTSTDNNKNLLDKFKEQKAASKVIDIAKNDTQMIMAKVMKHKPDIESSFDELRPKLTCGISKDGVAPPFGFKNYGVNCYINATLQCLLCIPEMNTYFLERQYRNSNLHSGKKLYPICDYIAELYDEAFSDKTPAWITPKSLVKICPSGQQDAHEFLWKRLVQKIFNEVDPPNKKPRKENLNGKQSWEWYKHNHQSIFELLFGGLYESQVECKRCGFRSLTYDPFLDISLPIQAKTLTGCLKLYFGPEELSKQDLYRCSKCKKPVAAIKRLTIFKPPKYLLLNFKRLVGTTKKIGAFIQYPNSLDIYSFCSGEEYETKYGLVALCVHNGSSSKGHYYAYGKRGDKVK